MAYTDWEPHQMVSLISEIHSARSLLDHGTAVLRGTFGTYDELANPVLTTLSIGMEKLYKLTIGLAALTSGGDWPTKNRMIGYRHNLAKLHAEVIAECRTRTTDPDLKAMIEGVVDDPGVDHIVAALSNYGMSGRFHYLDQIGNPQAAPAPDPRIFWEAIEIAITPPDSQLAKQRKAAYDQDTGSQDALAHSIQARNRRTADSVHRIRHMVAMCWKSGAFGELGDRFRIVLKPMVKP